MLHLPAPTRSCRLPLARYYTRKPSQLKPCPNAHIVDLLSDHMEVEAESASRNAFKVRAFANAITAIRSLDYPIQSAQQLRSLKGIGSGIVKRVEDYLAQTHDPTAPSAPAPASPASRTKATARLIINELQQVPGVGPAMAKSLHAAGCTSLAQMHLPAFSALLKPAQRACLPYVFHLAEPVPRAESEAVADFVRRHVPKEFEVVVAGSYRRGAPTSSDIDILLFHPAYTDIPPPPLPSPPPTTTTASSTSTRPKSRTPKQPKAAEDVHGQAVGSRRNTNAPAGTTTTPAPVTLVDVLTELTKRGLLVATMSSGARRWQGIVRVPAAPGTTRVESGEGGGESGKENGKETETLHTDKGLKDARDASTYRRMDLTLFPARARGAALVACTGDREFNVDLRARAARLGMHLNEMGLWRWEEAETRARSTLDSEVEPESAGEEASDADDNSDNNANESRGEDGRWHLLASDDERAILAELGMDWVEPARRNFAHLVDPKKRAARSSPDASAASVRTASSSKGRVRQGRAAEGGTAKAAGKGSAGSGSGGSPETAEGEREPRTEPETEPEKRGRGRPRKVEDAEPEPDAPKRGRGRPRSTTVEVQEQGSELAPEPVKRGGPERPKKSAAEDVHVHEAEPTAHDHDPAHAQKGPGRPRRTHLEGES